MLHLSQLGELLRTPSTSFSRMVVVSIRTCLAWVNCLTNYTHFLPVSPFFFGILFFYFLCRRYHTGNYFQQKGQSTGAYQRGGWSMEERLQLMRLTAWSPWFEWFTHSGDWVTSKQLNVSLTAYSHFQPLHYAIDKQILINETEDQRMHVFVRDRQP